VEAEEVAVGIAVVADKAVPQAPRLQAPRVLELQHRLVAEVRAVAVVADKAVPQALLYPHCQLLAEVLRPVVVAVAVVMAPGNLWELRQWNGSFISKVMAKTARERRCTTSPMEKSKTSVSTIGPLSEPGSLERRKAPSS
jgi:hypothetical protein